MRTAELAVLPGSAAEVLDDLYERGVLGPTWADWTKVVPDDSEQSFDRFVQLGLFLAKGYDAIRWWTADWLAQGEGMFGDRLYQAAETLGLSEGTLLDWLRIAQAVPRNRRHGRLRFTHHRAVAQRDLQPAQRTELLREAADTGLTVRELGERVKETLNGKAPVEGAARLSKKEQLVQAGEAVVNRARTNGSGDWIVPGEPMARLKAALGKE